MNPIDAMARRFLAHCFQSIGTYTYIEMVFDNSKTVAAAMHCMEAIGLECALRDGMKGVQFSLSGLRQCVDRLDEIRYVAKKVFRANFVDDAQSRHYIFRQEACFSYTCKLICSVGPLLCHFSNAPTKKEVVSAELQLSLHTPLWIFDTDDMLYCFEAMPEEEDLAMQIEP